MPIFFFIFLSSKLKNLTQVGQHIKIFNTIIKKKKKEILSPKLKKQPVKQNQDSVSPKWTNMDRIRQNVTKMDCYGPNETNRIELGYFGPKWTKQTELDRIALKWIEMDQTRLKWNEIDQMDRIDQSGPNRLKWTEWTVVD